MYYRIVASFAISLLSLTAACSDEPEPVPCTIDSECDDGLYCNGVETCSASLVCQAGTPPVADDNVACTDDSCDEDRDVVVNTANDANCDNGLFCDGTETCDALADCQAGIPPVAVDDGVACTDDLCDEDLDMLVNAANDAHCDDGLFCNGAETCDPALDCQSGTPVAVDDGVVCTDDTCDEANDVVVNVANDANCDDAFACNGAETCDPTLDCQPGTTPITCVAEQVSAGHLHTCVALSNGAVRCWGDGGSGRLGYGHENNIGDNETPASAGNVDVGGTVTQLAAGSGHTCALLDTGAVRCWGNGFQGRLGYGNTIDIGDNETPASAGNVDVGGFVTQITAGERHTCARLGTGDIRCWGSGFDGRLGYGNTSDIGDNETPASTGNVALGGPATQVVAGARHTCALLNTGAVRCWGDAASGKLGTANQVDIGDNELPTTVGVLDIGATVTQLDAGSSHTCALLDTSAVRCWGSGFAGKLGYGNTNNVGDNQPPSAAGDVPFGG